MEPSNQPQPTIKTNPLPAINSAELAAEVAKKQQQQNIPMPKILKLYVLPIATLIIFTSIVVFMVLPAVSGLFAGMDEISRLNNTVKQKDVELSQLQNLQSREAQLDLDLSAIARIVPTGRTEVVNFQLRVVSLASQFGLQVSEVETAEQVLQTGEENISALGIIEIPSNFTITGSLEQIKAFILSLETIDDFVIIGEMVVGADRQTAGLWNLDLLLIKYQFQNPDEQNQLLEAYSRVPITAEADEEILRLVRRSN